MFAGRTELRLHRWLFGRFKLIIVLLGYHEVLVVTLIVNVHLDLLGSVGGRLPLAPLNTDEGVLLLLAVLVGVDAKQQVLAAAEPKDGGDLTAVRGDL